MDDRASQTIDPAKLARLEQLLERARLRGPWQRWVSETGTNIWL
jgi:hypothetical protein